jgi:hypothetical protein
MLLGAHSSLRAEEVWPEQPSEQHHYPLPNSPPFGKPGERFWIPVYGAYFFKERRILNKFYDNPEIREQMLKNGEYFLFAEGRNVRALEHIRTWAGRVHDDEYGDGYLIILKRELF